MHARTANEEANDANEVNEYGLEKEKTTHKAITFALMVAPDVNVSDRRDSNPRPSAWEANALPTELLSHENEGHKPIRHRQRLNALLKVVQR